MQPLSGSLADLISVLSLALWSFVVLVWDLRHRQIPNLLIATAWVPALVVALVGGQGLLGQSLVSGLGGLVIAAVVTLPGFFRSALGGGDVKLAACLGWIGGWAGAMVMVLVAAVLLGLAAMVIVLRQRMGTGLAPASGKRLARFAAGPAFVIGFWAVLGLRLA